MITGADRLGDALENQKRRVEEIGDSLEMQAAKVKDRVRLNPLIQVDETERDLKQLELSAKRMDYHMKLATAVLQSGLAPKHFQNAQSLFVAIEYGVSTLGMEPMSALWNISVIQGKPSPSAASAVGAASQYLDEAHEYKYYDKEDNELPPDTEEAYKVVCLMKKGGKSYYGTFSMGAAQKAGLLKSGGGWEKYPKNMLEARAGMFAARKACPTVFAGIYSTEEVQYFKEQPSGHKKKEPATKVKKSATDAILEDLEDAADKKRIDSFANAGIVKEEPENTPAGNAAFSDNESFNSITDTINGIVKDHSQVEYDTLAARCKADWSKWKTLLTVDEWSKIVTMVNKTKDGFPEDIRGNA